MNPQPLHLDESFAAQSEFGQRLVNSLLTLSLLVGMTVYEQHVLMQEADTQLE